jgi:hypothetical protein
MCVKKTSLIIVIIFGITSSSYSMVPRLLRSLSKINKLSALRQKLSYLPTLTDYESKNNSSNNGYDYHNQQSNFKGVHAQWLALPFWMGIFGAKNDDRGDKPEASQAANQDNKLIIAYFRLMVELMEKLNDIKDVTRVFVGTNSFSRVNKDTAALIALINKTSFSYSDKQKQYLLGDTTDTILVTVWSKEELGQKLDPLLDLFEQFGKSQIVIKNNKLHKTPLFESIVRTHLL